MFEQLQTQQSDPIATIISVIFVNVTQAKRGRKGRELVEVTEGYVQKIRVKWKHIYFSRPKGGDAVCHNAALVDRGMQHRDLAVTHYINREDIADATRYGWFSAHGTFICPGK